MAKLKLDPKKIAAVKEVASGKLGQKLAEKAQQLKGGVQLSAYDRAAGKKLLTGLTTDKAAAAASGSPMGGKAVAAQGRGGQTMGQKAVKAQGKGGPVVKAIKETLTGKPAPAPAPIAKKEEELKVSTYELPTVFEVGGHTYDKQDVLDAIKKTESTYGKDSRAYRALVSALGNQSKEGLAFTGLSFKKPDLRKDAGKSYVDTAQRVLGAHSFPRTGGTGADYGAVDDDIAIRLLNQFGAKGARNLGRDKNSVIKK